MSAEIRFYQPGAYPRSERVVAATRGLERGRVTQAEVDAAYQQDLVDFVELQRQARVDFYSDGLLRWQDIFRPLAHAAGMPARILTRWFDNNAFFRAPEADAGLSRFDPTALPVPDASVPQPRVATLPSPYMFSRAVVTSTDRDRLMRDLARDVLHPAATRLVAAGCKLIHLQEPWLAYHGIDRGSVPALERALAEVGEGLDAGIVLHLYFGDAAPFLDWLRRLPVHAVGIDLVETDHRSLGSGWEIGLLAGCVDGRSSMVEDVDRTAELVRTVADTAQPPVLYVSSSCDLELLPREVARQKVLSLGRAVQRVAEPVPR
jgi:5-methyltetrahydropteroyltriglutamate--homocysteine methyltransferase